MNDLIINAIDIYRVDKAIEKPYRLSWGTIDRFFAMVFEIHAEEWTGVGEAVTERWELGLKMAERLVGKDANELGTLLSNLEVSDQEVRACREGLTFALYDLVGKARGKPVWDLLGGMKRREFRLRPVVFIETPDEMVNEISRLVDSGFTAVKIKFAGDLEEDFSRLARVRNTFGPGLDIQADVNMGYKEETSFLALVKKIQGLGLSIIEDPCWLTTEGYALLRKKLHPTGIKLMLDEPVRTVKDIETVCRAEAADIINQHPNCQGGPDFLVQGQQLVRQAGLENMIGGMTGYFGIADVGYYSASAALGTGYVELTPTEMYQGIRLAKIPHRIEKGKVTLDPAILGCGVRLDEPAMKKVLAEHRHLK